MESAWLRGKQNGLVRRMEESILVEINITYVCRVREIYIIQRERGLGITYIYMCMCVCVNIYIYVHMYVYINMYKQIHTYICI